MIIESDSHSACRRCNSLLVSSFAYCPGCGLNLQDVGAIKYISISTPAPPREFLEGKIFKSLEINEIKKTLKRRKRRQKLIKGFLLSFAILFMVVAGVLWVLSILNVVPGYWAAIFGVVFAVLGVLFSFFQWFLPQVAESSEEVKSTVSR